MGPVLHTNYHSGDQAKKTEIGRTCSTYKDSRGAYRVLVWKHERSRPRGKPRRRWEDNIKINLRKVGMGGGGVDWIDLAQERDR